MVQRPDVQRPYAMAGRTIRVRACFPCLSLSFSAGETSCKVRTGGISRGGDLGRGETLFSPPSRCPHIRQGSRARSLPFSGCLFGSQGVLEPNAVNVPQKTPRQTSQPLTRTARSTLCLHSVNVRQRLSQGKNLSAKLPSKRIPIRRQPCLVGTCLAILALTVVPPPPAQRRPGSLLSALFGPSEASLCGACGRSNSTYFINSHVSQKVG